MTAQVQALAGLRILDLSRVLAGPLCTQHLADLGAEVIKVERPHVGDDTRQWGPPWAPDENGRDSTDSAWFQCTNRNKKSVVADLSCQEGQDVIRALIKHCDVLVENFKVGDLKRYGLGYEDLKQINPQIIYCSITGYGQEGPYAHRPGYDFVFQGECGLMSVTGERDELPGGGPQKVGVPVVDFVTGMYATVAILAALKARDAGSGGQHIDIALLDCGIALGINLASTYALSGVLPRRYGNSHPNTVPYQTFQTADGHINVATGNDGQWQRLCKALERPDLANDGGLMRVQDRTAARESLIPQLESTLRQRTSQEWLARLEACGVPAGAINNYAQVFEDPHVKARGVVTHVEDTTGRSIATIANPIRMSGTPVQYRRPSPRLGEHTAEVLGSLLGIQPAA
jgi:crotonobetainyl-CoA:carnitine CoA-transferase CaiB-like acyl-CoA transferase